MTSRDRDRDQWLADNCRYHVYAAKEEEQNAIYKARQGNMYLASRARFESECAWIGALETLLLWLHGEPRP